MFRDKKGESAPKLRGRAQPHAFFESMMGFVKQRAAASKINKEENMKKTLALLLALTMVFTLFASQTAFADDADDIHIGIITGSVSHGQAGHLPRQLHRRA